MRHQNVPGVRRLVGTHGQGGGASALHYNRASHDRQERQGMRVIVISSAACLCAVAFTLADAVQAASTAYPNKPIRMIVPWNPGGTSDTIARILGQKMTETWGQQV